MNRTEKDKVGQMDQKKYILLVEDVDDFRQEYIKVWKFFGYEVVPAINGMELLQKADDLIKKQKNFIIIVDNQIPEDADQLEAPYCGFKTILTLCKAHPDVSLGDRVIFLSVWGRRDMPPDLLAEADGLNLLRDNQWFRRYTSFSVIRNQVKRFFNEV